MKQKCIFVLGMHRSGTSALAGVLYSLGVSFGKDLLEADKFNEKGFFENKRFLKCNNELLNELGSNWIGDKDIPPNWINSEIAEKYKDEIKKIILEEFSDKEIFAIKDPRICLLLELYLKILKELKIKPIFIITLRDEEEIALSLYKRSKIPIDKALFLTKKHYHHVYKVIGENYLQINFEELINTPKKVIKKILIETGINADENFIKKAENFISPELKHNNFSKKSFVSEISDLFYEKDQGISALKQDLVKLKSEKDQSISALKQDLVKLRFKKNKEINKLIKELESKNTSLYNINSKLIDKERLIKLIQKDLANEKNISDNLKTILRSIERSLTWKTLKRFQRLINFLMPEKTYIRTVYDRLIKFNQRLINKDLGDNFEIRNKKSFEESFWDTFFEGNKKIDILFINHEESRTGAPKILFEIAKFMKSKYKIAIVSKKEGSMHEEFAKTFEKIIYPQRLYSGCERYFIARKIIEKIKPSLVYVNSLVGREYAFVAKELGIPVIFHLHEFGSCFDKVLDNNEMNNFTNSADKFIAVSKHLRDFLIKRFNCPKEKIALINEFIDINQILKKSMELDKSNRISRDNKNNKIIVGCGSFVFRKGADIFIESYKNLQEKYPGRFKFVWIGDYSEYSSFLKPEFISIFEKAKNGDGNLILLGEVENPYPFLKASDIFVLPSREDPFPLVALEAMALGKPLIAFQEGGGISEAIHGNGVIVKKIDSNLLSKAIFQLSMDRNLSKRYSTNSKRVSRNYDSKKILPEIDKLIRVYIAN